jgi:hypothetical protein
LSSGTLGVFNQVWWAGVGDADECWIIATFWALVATGVMSRDQLPSIDKFRAAAGRPDLPGPSGGNNSDIIKALAKLAPDADVRGYNGLFAGFKKALQNGYVASLSVDSNMLPKYLQFGFKGLHQVSIYYSAGKYYVMNPLAKEGSGLLQISEFDLRMAATSYLGDGDFHAVLIKAGPEKPHKNPVTSMPRSQPRDFNYQVTVRNYLDPWVARDVYQSRHKRRSVDVKQNRR